MSSFRSPSSNQGAQSSSQKKPSFLVRFIKGTFFQIFVFFTTIILLGVGYAAWTTLDRNDAADGKPVTQTLMQGIIDNINDLGARVTTLESGQTTGGTVTGPLRWSSEYGTMAYSNAWTTCLGLTPINEWRLPSSNEIEYGKRVNSGLFTGSKNYWSASPDSSSGTGFTVWNPTLSFWNYCGISGTMCNGYYASNGAGGFSYYYYPMAFRCVSNAN